MAARDLRPTRAMMLGTFGFRPKATMRSRALGIAEALQARGWDVLIGTTPWDFPADAGRAWVEHGVRVVNTRSTRPALWPLAVGEMVVWRRSYSPALLHVFKPKGFGDLAGRLLRHGTPLVLDMDDWEGDGGWNATGLYGPVQRRVFDWQERTLPALSRSVTVASRELERRAIALGAAANGVHYVPNGLPVSRLAELAGDGSPRDDWIARVPVGSRVLLYTRFVEFRPSFVVAALARVVSVRPDAHLVVAGASTDGGPEQSLWREAARAGLSWSIDLLGWIEPAALGALARSCALAVLPFDDTPLNRAKCSVKLLELMAAGTAVVAGRVGENAQYLEHGVSGWLVDPGDPASLAAGALRLLEDGPLRQRLGAAAAARARCHYPWDRVVDRVLDAYAQALDRSMTSGVPSSR